MTSNAVKAFMKGKNVILGGNISVAAGPLGRYLDRLHYSFHLQFLCIGLDAANIVLWTTRRNEG
jgi:hypothetical protein